MMHWGWRAFTNVLIWILRFFMKRRTWYRNVYLRSPHWRHKRIEVLKRAGFQCKQCSRKAQEVLLDVHHLTYAHLFYEFQGDLQVLCRRCHTDRHD